jgi:tRNA (uracil-5-)-methyltransferase
MPIECTLFCKAFRSVDPGAIGRFLGTTLQLTSASEGRTVWILKDRGDRIARARFSAGITTDQIRSLLEGEMVFREEAIKCDKVDEFVSDTGEERPGKKVKRGTIEDLCIPWHGKPYSEQLSAKKALVSETLAGALSRVKSSAKQRGYRPLPEWSDLRIEDTLFVSSEDGSPLHGYRNKCEFTFGMNETGSPDIGFMHTRATATTEPVVAAGEHLMHVSPQIRDIVVSLRAELLSNIDEFPLFSHRTKIGFWRLVSIRACPTTLESQVVIQSGPAEGESKENFESLLLKWAQSTDEVTSMFVQYNSSVTDTISNSELHDLKLLYGSESIKMAIGDEARFKVHPLSFFQTNSRACKVLYDQVATWVNMSQATILFDVCCGVGTIGQYIGRRLGDRKIIGVDIVEQAVTNAKANATLNNLEDMTEYLSGRAEEVLPSVIEAQLADGRSGIAVVDPPRSGLHKTVIRAIRENESIKSLIYVSCNPKTLAEDLVKFCEPLTSCHEEEGTAVNHRFVPNSAVAVDMFPNTVHCEVVVALVRP